MKYKNIHSGEIREFVCTLSSKVWEPVTTKAPKPAKEIDEKPDKKVTKK